MRTASLSFLLPFLAALALSSTTGCATLHACTDEARSSVGVTVIDDNGAPVTDATLTYSVDGGPQKDCEHNDPTSNGYVCAYEEAGHFVITATRGSATATAQADVAEGECHVVGVSTTITLPAR